MRKKLLICLTLLTSLTFVSCFKNNDGGKNPAPETETEEPQSTEKPSLEKPPIEEPSLENTSTPPSSNNTSSSETKPKPEKPKPATPKPDTTERTFKIVTKDIDYNVVQGKNVVTVGLGVADNIKKILDVVSKNYFNGTPLELKDIETVNGKKIAVINLAGSKDYWQEKCQGSLGGAITEYTLIENVLQKEYKGYWIDGVKFTLNGVSFKGSDHVPKLGQVTFR